MKTSEWIGLVVALLMLVVGGGEIWYSTQPPKTPAEELNAEWEKAIRKDAYTNWLTIRGPLADIPKDCYPDQEYIDTDAPIGRELYFCWSVPRDKNTRFESNWILVPVH